MRSDSLTRSSAAPRHAGAAFGERGGDEQDREFVDHVRHECFGHLDAVQRCRGARAGRRPARRPHRREFSHVECCAPISRSACSRPVRRGLMPTPANRRSELGNHASPRRGRTRPRKSRAGTSMSTCPSGDGRHRLSPNRALELDRPAERGQHAFGVVARRMRFAHASFAVGVQAGQQYADFTCALATGGVVVDALQIIGRRGCAAAETAFGADRCARPSPPAVRSRGASGAATAIRRRPGRSRMPGRRASPASRRMPVPALPQSSGSAGGAQPCSPTPCTMRSLSPALRCARPWRGTHGGRARVLAFEEIRVTVANAFGNRRQHNCADAKWTCRRGTRGAAPCTTRATIRCRPSSTASIALIATLDKASFSRAVPTLMRRNAGKP